MSCNKFVNTLAPPTPFVVGIEHPAQEIHKWQCNAITSGAGQELFIHKWPIGIGFLDHLPVGSPHVFGILCFRYALIRHISQQGLQTTVGNMWYGLQTTVGNMWYVLTQVLKAALYLNWKPWLAVGSAKHAHVNAKLWGKVQAVLLKWYCICIWLGLSSPCAR